MLQFMYTADYDDCEDDASDASKSSDYTKIKNNINVYALAEKYDVRGLDALSKAKVELFKDSNDWMTAPFADLAKLVYETTSSNNRGLRDVIKTICAREILQLLEVDKWHTVIKHIQELSFDILGAVTPVIREWNYLRLDRDRTERSLTYAESMTQEPRVLCPTCRCDMSRPRELHPSRGDTYSLVCKRCGCSTKINKTRTWDPSG